MKFVRPDGRVVLKGSEMSGALAGVMVLELSANRAGAIAARILAEQGAEVVRVDRPLGQGAPEADPHAAHRIDHGKRSVGIDLTTTTGRQLLDRVATYAEVVVVGVTSEQADRVDGVLAWLDNVSSDGVRAVVVGDADEHHPDLAGALAAQAICAALVRRFREGRGSEIVVADGRVTTAQREAVLRPITRPDDVPGVLPASLLAATSDGFVRVDLSDEAALRSVMRTVDRLRSISVPANRIDPELRPVEAALAGMTTAEAVGMLRSHEVGCEPVVELDDLWESVGAEVDTRPPSRGDACGCACRTAVQVTGVLTHYLRPAPPLGRDTDAFLQECGLTPHEVAALRRSAVIF